MKQSVRLRFAPSPHGGPHPGNIKTAIINWLYARKHFGQFIVRIDDTNRKRHLPDSIESIRQTLFWLGIEWDEGLGKGGDYGPYRQSERLETYHSYVRQLLNSGFAYRCDCSSQRLDSLRKQQIAKGAPVGYDGFCRDKKINSISADEPHVVRFKVTTAEKLVFTDLIWGRQEFDSEDIEDFVLIRSNRYPTYHMAVVIDDHLMKISHVIRADSLIPSTPKHLLLYNLFGWLSPTYAHFPLILGEDGRKLSKRHGSIAVLDFKELGYLPDTLFNYIACLGLDADVIERADSSAKQNLLEGFDLKKISRSPSTFSFEKLLWLNGKYLRNLSLDAFVANLVDYYTTYNEPFEEETLKLISPYIQTRVKTFKDVMQLLDFLFSPTSVPDYEGLAQVQLNHVSLVDILNNTCDCLTKIDEWSEQGIESAIRNLFATLYESPKSLFDILRLSLTGQPVSPPIFISICALGREEALQRLSKVIDYFSS